MIFLLLLIDFSWKNQPIPQRVPDISDGYVGLCWIMSDFDRFCLIMMLGYVGNLCWGGGGVLLDMKKSNGRNSIPVFILKILKPFFSSWHSKLVIYPSLLEYSLILLKLLRLHPFIKKNVKLTFRITDQSCYLFCKKIEKTIYTRIYTYLVKNNLIFDKQFGFHHKYY